MRELKFRFWNGTCMNELDDLYMFEEDGMHSFEDGARYYNYIFMQYTGLNDKNGKEIYEGDIVQTKRKSKIKGHITMYQGCWCICHYYTYYKLFYSFADVQSIEVIGNIYENPELLEG